MGQIISIANRKGGCGKTTTAQALASFLNRKKKKTLLIDLDSQCNLSANVGADVNSVNILSVMQGEATAENAVQSLPSGDIIAGSLALSSIVDTLNQKMGREYRLAETLKDIKEHYDFIIIDTPPELSLLTMNALTASDSVIIVSMAESFSLDGVSQLYNVITDVKKYTNPNIKINGILLTRYNKRTILAQNMKASLEEFAQENGTKVYSTVIRNNIAIGEAQASGVDLFEYAKNSAAVKDYTDFGKEFLKG